MYDLIVVGGGPAGLTAMIYGLRKRLHGLLVSKDLGGKTNFRLELPGLDDYQVIRGIEVVGKFKSELEYLDFARRMDVVEKVTRQEDGFEISTRNGKNLRSRAVIIATGARQKKLDVPGEQDYLSRGLCYSALSYAPLFIDKHAVVIGEGELALRSAGELSTVAGHVHVVGPSGEILTTPLGKKLLSAENVTILEGYRVVSVKGNGYCNRVVVQSPEGEQTEITADGTFIEKGLVPNTQMVAGLVALDEQGRIKVDGHNRTSVPGLFAAGDVTDTFAEQVLIAVGEGAKAALSAYEYLLPML